MKKPNIHLALSIPFAIKFASRMALVFSLAVTSSLAYAQVQTADDLENATDEIQAQSSDSKAQKKAARIKSSARNLSYAFRMAAEKALPSVVKILSKSRQTNSESSVLDILGAGDDTQEFDSVGSGVIISTDGLILTNHHVIKDSIRIEVRLPDGRGFEVVETKSDPRSDVAIVKIEPNEDLPVAELGDSKGLFVGDWVLAIGSPFMLESSVSAGIISGTKRQRQLSRIVSGQFLQTDAAINPGNSGGPLVDLEGRVIGINTAISSRTGGFQGIGFAIPIDRADWIKSELIEYDRVRRGYVGIGTGNISFEQARELGLSTGIGVEVRRVAFERPGYEAGVKSGDVIIEFAGDTVGSAAEFADMVQQSPIGVPLELVIIREGERMTLELNLQERPQ